MAPLLDVRDLRTSFRTDDGIVRAVDGVSFTLEQGRTLGIVGESGSGKSVTCLTLLGLNDRRTTVVEGEALFKGRDLLTLPPRELRGDPRQRDRDDLPGSDDLAEPRAAGGEAARRGGAAAPATSACARPAHERSSS